MESGPSHLPALVTRDSSAPTAHYVRRGRGCVGNQGLRSGKARAVGFASAECPKYICFGNHHLAPEVADRSRLCMQV